MTYVIGDVHGMFDEFLILLDAIHQDAARTASDLCNILIVGDLVDRGPRSADLIAYLIENQDRLNIQSVQGNHDAWFCENVRDAKNNTLNEEELFNWLTQGGYETLASYEKVQPPRHSFAALSIDALREKLCAIPEEHIRFAKGLPLMIETDHCIVTHALCDRRYYDLLQKYKGSAIPDYVRLFVQWNRDEPDQAISTTKMHVSGHTPVRNARYFRRTNAANVDTGAVFGGSLSALCVETGHLFGIDVKTHRFVQTHLKDR